MRLAAPSGLPALWLACAILPAQGLDADRRVNARIEQMRLELAEACLAASPERRARAAEELLGDGGGNPLVPLARAIARARGVEPDAAWTARSAVVLFVTPEVPDGKRFTVEYLTLHLPFVTELPGRVGARLEVRNQDGETVWRGVLDRNTAVEDLLRYRARVEVPLGDLPDGRYEVEGGLWIDDAGPRRHDPRLGGSFTLLRDFPERAGRLAKAVERLDSLSLDRRDRAMLHAARDAVGRLVWGLPPAGPSRPRRDLEVAERIVANIDARRDPLEGLRGWVDVAVPAGEGEEAQVRLRIPSPQAQPRAVALFVPGAPAWDRAWKRPMAPRATHPGWMSHLLGRRAFDAEERLVLAVMESPGRLRDVTTATLAVLDALRDRYGLQDAVLVGERDGAVAVLAAASRQPRGIAGVVVVCGGALDRGAARALAAVRLLAIPGTGHPTTANLERMSSAVGEDGAGPELELLDDRARPWAVALALELERIETWALRALR